MVDVRTRHATTPWCYFINNYERGLGVVNSTLNICLQSQQIAKSSICQGPCCIDGVDDCTWLAEGLKTLSVLIPDKKCNHHGIMLLAC